MLSLLLLACTATSEPDPEPEPEFQAGRVLVVGWDGVRADAIEALPTPNLDRVGAWGGLSTQASTQLTGPTSSGPGWMSILTGVEPSQHGVFANGEYDGRDPSWPTAFSVAHQAGHRTFAAVHWPEIVTSILEPEAVDDAVLGSDAGVTDAIVEQIAWGDATLLFAHFDDPDHAGHDTGFRVDNPDYAAAVTGSDAHLGELLSAIGDSDQQWLVLVTTDHGGEGTGHGPMEPIYHQIFFAGGVVGGEGGWELEGATHMDVFATALDFLGLVAETQEASVSRLP